MASLDDWVCLRLAPHQAEGNEQALNRVCGLYRDSRALVLHRPTMATLGGRLQLPLFVLSAPIVAGAFTYFPYGTRVLGILCFVLFAPAIADTWMYQLAAPTLFVEPPVPGMSAARKIRESTGCRRVGLDFTGVTALREGRLLSVPGVGMGGTYVRHINVGAADDLNQFCAILCLACDAKPKQVALYREAGLHKDERERDATLFLR
jgi:hypothetical protein